MIISLIHAGRWLEFLLSATSVVKVLTFFSAWAIVWLPIAIPLAKRVKWHPLKPFSAKQKITMLSSLYLIAPLIVWIAAGVEGLSFADYGLSWRGELFISLVFGFCLALAGLVIIFGLELLLGWIQWQWENSQRLVSTFLPILGLGLWVGFTEELVFRGFLINELAQDYPLFIAAIASSAIFAFLHLVWEQKETIPQLPGLWLMGMVLVYARLVDDGMLGLAWGLHAGWIFGLSCLQGTELICPTGKAKVWIAGIEGQPLAGIIGILCLLGTATVLRFFE